MPTYWEGSKIVGQSGGTDTKGNPINPTGKVEGKDYGSGSSGSSGSSGVKTQEQLKQEMLASPTAQWASREAYEQAYNQYGGGIARQATINTPQGIVSSLPDINIPSVGGRTTFLTSGGAPFDAPTRDYDSIIAGGGRVAPYDKSRSGIELYALEQISKKANEEYNAKQQAQWEQNNKSMPINKMDDALYNALNPQLQWQKDLGKEPIEPYVAESVYVPAVYNAYGRTNYLAKQSEKEADKLKVLEFQYKEQGNKFIDNQQAEYDKSYNKLMNINAQYGISRNEYESPSNKEFLKQQKIDTGSGFLIDFVDKPLLDFRRVAQKTMYEYSGGMIGTPDLKQKNFNRELSDMLPDLGKMSKDVFAINDIYFGTPKSKIQQEARGYVTEMGSYIKRRPGELAETGLEMYALTGLIGAAGKGKLLGQSLLGKTGSGTLTKVGKALGSKTASALFLGGLAAIESYGYVTAGTGRTPSGDILSLNPKDISTPESRSLARQEFIGESVPNIIAMGIGSYPNIDFLKPKKITNTKVKGLETIKQKPIETIKEPIEHIKPSQSLLDLGFKQPPKMMKISTEFEPITIATTIEPTPQTIGTSQLIYGEVKPIPFKEMPKSLEEYFGSSITKGGMSKTTGVRVRIKPKPKPKLTQVKDKVYDKPAENPFKDVSSQSLSRNKAGTSSSSQLRRYKKSLEQFESLNTDEIMYLNVPPGTNIPKQPSNLLVVIPTIKGKNKYNTIKDNMIKDISEYKFINIKPDIISEPKVKLISKNKSDIMNIPMSGTIDLSRVKPLVDTVVDTVVGVSPLLDLSTSKETLKVTIPKIKIPKDVFGIPMPLSFGGSPGGIYGGGGRPSKYFARRRVHKSANPLKLMQGKIVVNEDIHTPYKINDLFNLRPIKPKYKGKSKVSKRKPKYADLLSL